MLHLLRIPPRCTLVRQLRSTSQGEFKTVYKFPYVRGIGVINRLKLYQTVLTAVALPGATILSQLNYLTYDDILLTLTAGLTGIVYVNDKSNLVRFAYLDFWGARKDVTIPTNEIVPLSECKSSPTDILYLKVRQYSSKDTLKLCPRYGILDYEGFNKIFIS